MRCVVSATKPAVAVLLLLGAVIVVSVGTRAAHANEPDAAPARSWCVARSDVPPNCVHSDLVSCSIAALLTGGFCIREEPASPASTVAAAPPRQKRSVARRKASASQQDELFREFEQWKRTSAQ